jgi:uroporphyrinogen decarboxylase
MTSRERILAAMDHKVADRVPFWESYWGSAIARWKTEGLPEGVDPGEYFGLDPTHWTSVDWTMQFPVETVEETEEFIIRRSANGTLEKNFKGHDTTPFWWDFQLRDRATWEELKPRFAWNETRIDLEKAKTAFAANKDRFQIYMPACVGFEKFKYIMGMEGILIAFGEDPDWVQEMCMSTAELSINGLEYLLDKGFHFDVAFVTEDNGFRDRAFVSPRTYREVVLPCQKRFCEFCHARGIRVMLHTCGYNMDLLPLYIEAGFDVLNPMEVKAGMDPLKIKKDYGDVLTLWGGIDVRAIAHPDPTVLENEIKTKVPVLSKGGGYIFCSDHSIPDNVSLERYRYMLELGHKYGTFAGAK